MTASAGLMSLGLLGLTFLINEFVEVGMDL